MKVLVYGGTGVQGGAVAQALLERQHEVYVLSRDGKKGKELEKAGAKIVLGNTSDLNSLVEVSQGMDAIALMTPLFTDVNPAISAENAIKAAQAAEVNFIVWNTSAQAPDEETGNPLIDHQKRTTELLEESGLKYIKLVPSIYAENLLGPYTAPFVAKENKLTYPAPKEMQINWLPMMDLGRITAIALEKPELSGKTFSIGSTERLDGEGLAKAFSEGLGKTIHYEVMEPKQFGEILNETFGPGAGDAVAKDYQRFHDEPESRYIWQIDTKPMTEAFGAKTTPIADWVKQYKQLFT